MIASQVSQNTGEISTEIETIFYVEWKVQDIHLLSADTTHTIQSSSFQFKDETWYFLATIYGTEFRPYDMLKMTHVCGPIDLHLVREDFTTPKLNVDCKIGIKPVDGHTYGPKLTTCVFDIDANSHVCTNLVSRLDERIIEAPNGEVTFICYFRLENCGSLDAVSTMKMSEDLGKLGTDLKNLFLSGQDSDVTIRVKDKEFKAHKCVLSSRSPVFYSMFTHDVAEENSGTVDIADCDPDAFEIFLIYLYSGSMENLLTNNVFDLYKVADKYDAKELKLLYKDFMLSNLSVDTVCDVIEHALQYDESELLKTATEIFAKNLKNVIQTVKWQSFLKKNSVAANELLIKATNYYVLKE